jgi:hypothetical protein
MGLAWQQGPLATGSPGHFLTEQPLPARLLFAEPLRRRMRVRFADRWIADSEDVVLLHEPGRYPVAYFPRGDVEEGILLTEDRVTQHPDLGDTAWFGVAVGERQANTAPGSTPVCHSTPRFWTGGWRSPGAPWTPSTKKTSVSSVTPPTPTIASTSAPLHGISWSATAIG